MNERRNNERGGGRKRENEILSVLERERERAMQRERETLVENNLQMDWKRE